MNKFRPVIGGLVIRLVEHAVGNTERAKDDTFQEENCLMMGGVEDAAVTGRM